MIGWSDALSRLGAKTSISGAAGYSTSTVAMQPLE